MSIDTILQLCRSAGIPTESWYTSSLPDTPIQIYDRPGYKALLDIPNNRFSIFDRRLSVLFPIIDNGSNLMTEVLMSEKGWKMKNTIEGYRVAECFKRSKIPFVDFIDYDPIHNREILEKIEVSI